jgi:hypothetical protein
VKGLLVAWLVLVASAAAVACSNTDEQGSEETVYREETVVVEKTVPREAPEAGAKKLPPGNSKDGPGYDRIADDSGSVSAEIPTTWDERLTDEEATLGDEAEVVPSVTASTNLDAWHESGKVPGVFLLASARLAQAYTDDELLDPPYNQFSSRCELGERRDFERGPYSGRIQKWGDCYGEEEGTIYTVAAATGDRECVAVMQISTYGEEDREAAERILDTFEADCGRAAGYDAAANPEPEATNPAEPAPEDGKAVGCEDFVTMSGEPSQWQAQQFFVFEATPEQRAILDPDGNGFACDGGLGVPGPADGVCEGPGEADPDCAAAMLEAMCGQYASREEALQAGLPCCPD